MNSKEGFVFLDFNGKYIIFAKANRTLCIGCGGKAETSNAYDQPSCYPCAYDSANPPIEAKEQE